VFGVWCLVFGVWCLVFGVWCLGGCFLLLNFYFLLFTFYIMQKPVLIYCYDAYCGWCYGFSKVIVNIAEKYKNQLDFEVLSGGMIMPEKPVHIGISADYIAKAIPVVEEATGIKFGSDFLWHINNPDDSDWYPHSEKPAIALCIFKEYYPDRAIEFAADLQYSLNFEGRDLTDDEAYRHLLEKYSINEESFYQKLSSEEYKDMAHYEFSLVQQLKVEGYPCVFIQTKSATFHLIAKGYTDEETLSKRIDNLLQSL
jgi:putative protein-disulfide isomerase